MTIRRRRGPIHRPIYRHVYCMNIVTIIVIHIRVGFWTPRIDMDQLCSDIYISELDGFAHVFIYQTQQKERAVTEHAGRLKHASWLCPNDTVVRTEKTRVGLRATIVLLGLLTCLCVAQRKNAVLSIERARGFESPLLLF